MLDKFDGFHELFCTLLRLIDKVPLLVPSLDLLGGCIQVHEICFFQEDFSEFLNISNLLPLLRYFESEFIEVEFRYLILHAFRFHIFVLFKLELQILLQNICLTILSNILSRQLSILKHHVVW